MASVKVWNDNTYEFAQEVKGTMIKIPPKGFVEMDYEEAIDFKGMFSPMPPQDFAGDHAIFYKMIRVEPPAKPTFVDDGLTNHLTGQREVSPEALAAALAQVTHLMVKDPAADPAADRAAAEKDRGVIADLRQQLAELKALVNDLTPVEKRGPGRPRKEA